MTRSDLRDFLKTQQYAVLGSVSSSRSAHAALVGIAVTDALELIFDSVDSSRKVQNIRQNPLVAFFIGGMTLGDERTVQYEGFADEPAGSELDRLKKVYYAQFPHGPRRLTWPGLVYIRVKPTWIKYSDFNKNPPEILEFDDLGNRS